MSPAARAFLDDLTRAARPPMPTMALAAERREFFIRPFDDVDFEDNSLLGRISQIRNVSFMTFVETPTTNFYFGVNKSGLVGLHFSNLR